MGGTATKKTAGRKGVEMSKHSKAKELLFGTEYTQISPVKVAPALGVSPSTVYNWKNDVGKMPLSKVIILARLQRLSDEDKLAIFD